MRKKLLLVVPSLRGGGAERVMATLCRHIDSDSFEVNLALLQVEGSYLADIPGHVVIHDLAVSKARLVPLRLVRLLLKLKPDLVLSTHGHLNLVLSFVTFFLPKGIKFIGRESTIISQMIDEYPFPRSLTRLVFRIFYRRFDHLISQSYDMENDLISYLGLPEKKIKVIGNPIDFSRLKSKSVDKRDESTLPPSTIGALELVYVGRLVEVKGCDKFLAALSMVKRPLSVLILGTGPLLEDLRAQSDSLGLDFVRFIGFSKNPYPYIRKSDALVLTSRCEGLPNVVLESLALGTPVISFECFGDMKLIVQSGNNGELVANQNIAALASTIEGFSPSKYQEEVVVNSVIKYDVQNVCRQYEQLFRDVCSND